MVESHRDISELKKALNEQLAGEDRIDSIEGLLQPVIDGSAKVVRVGEDGQKAVVEDLEEEMKDCPAYFIYKEDLEMKKKFFAEVETLESQWQMFADEEERKVYTKFEDGETKISVFSKCKIKAHAYYPLFLLAQTNHFKDWIPSVVRSEELKKVSDLRRVIHLEREFPWPLYNREMICGASGCFIREKGAILMMLRSLNEEKAKLWGVELPAEDESQRVRAEMVRMFQFLEVGDQDSCWLSTYICVDPKFSYIPDFILNNSIKRVLYVMLGRMSDKQVFNDLFQKAHASFDKELDKRIKEKLQEYGPLPSDLP